MGCTTYGVNTREGCTTYGVNTREGYSRVFGGTAVAFYDMHEGYSRVFSGTVSMARLCVRRLEGYIIYWSIRWYGITIYNGTVRYGIPMGRYSRWYSIPIAILWRYSAVRRLGGRDSRRTVSHGYTHSVGRWRDSRRYGISHGDTHSVVRSIRWYGTVSL